MKKEVLQAPEMFAHVEAWISSGLSQRVFCEQRQVVPHIFYYWLRRYRLKQLPPEQKGFIPIRVSPTKLSETPRIEVLGVNGNRIVFYDWNDYELYPERTLPFYPLISFASFKPFLYSSRLQ
jgi:hypothetical protein